MKNQPFFYDITLRDGNQSLKKPWNMQEKEIVFNHILQLGVQGIEVGFSASSEVDFSACKHLAKIAPNNVVIAGLARAVESDIIKVAKAIDCAPKPRIHTFIAMNPFNMEHVLNKPPMEVQKTAIEAVEFAKKTIGSKGEIEFSVEHFGDCIENIDFVIESLKKIINAGATIINLPNTVERTRIKTFVELVERVYKALPKDITISVHCHNDLGMATAATVESFFAGAIQLECSLNGLGERAGNTNLYEVAVALHNSGVKVPLNFSKMYETALVIAEMSKIPIHEKAALTGAEVLAHRSGIHQDATIKTKHLKKGAYRAINPTLIGRNDEEKLGFTSQSGKTAIYEILSSAGYPISYQEAIRITPIAKKFAQKIGELSLKKIVDIYMNEIFNVKGPFELIAFDKISEEKYQIEFKHNNNTYNVTGIGNGPLDACLKALHHEGFGYKLLHYEQKALDEEILGSKATAMSIIHFENPNGGIIISRGKDESTMKANVKAVFNGLNIIVNDFK